MDNAPKHWTITDLHTIALWSSGGTPNRSVAEYYNGTIPWIKTGDLNDSILNEVGENITEVGLKNSSAKVFPKGAVAIAMYGATIGKTAILGMDAATNQACAVARPYEGVDARYLFYYLRSQKQNFVNLGKGGAQPNISQTVLKQYPFPLAPYNEQKRVADKLDALFSRLDIINSRLEKIPVLLKQFRERVLTLAITGELTNEWRKRLNRNISSWNTQFIKNCTSQIQYGYTASSTYEDVGPKMLRITDIQNNNVNWGEVPKCEISDAEKGKYLLQKGDIVFARTGATVGKSYLIDSEIPEAVFASYLIRLKVTKENSAKYVWYFFNSQEYWTQIKTNAKGIGQPNVNGTILSNLTIPVPPWDEQVEIVNIIDKIFSIANKIEKHHTFLSAKIDVAPGEILSMAFRGELTKQDLNDEPIELLLERITNQQTVKRK